MDLRFHLQTNEGNVIKNDEQANPNSCLNRALPTERLFVLLARDSSAPETIRFWVDHRIRSGKNKESDPVITEALACASAMESERSDLRTQMGKPAG
jgi:hypothetical protein